MQHPETLAIAAMALAVSAIMVVVPALADSERAIGEPLRLHPSPAFGCP